MYNVGKSRHYAPLFPRDMAVSENNKGFREQWENTRKVGDFIKTKRGSLRTKLSAVKKWGNGNGEISNLHAKKEWDSLKGGVTELTAKRGYDNTLHPRRKTGGNKMSERKSEAIR
jgi:hypothetical protein